MVLNDIQAHFFISLIQSTKRSKILGNKKMGYAAKILPLSLFTFVFSFFPRFFLVESFAFIVVGKIFFYIGISVMLEQMLRNLIETKRKNNCLSPNNSVFKSYISDKTIHNITGVGPILPFLEKIKVQFSLSNNKNHLPKGYLLVGPPGTGKTLLGQVIAGETKARFFPVVASEFLIESGKQGSAKLRSFFREVKEYSPSIIFIDEIDSIGGVRTGCIGNTKKFRLDSTYRSISQTNLNTDSPRFEMSSNITNEFLIQIDGFAPQNNMIVIGATNFVHTMDRAFLRPGRFDCIMKLNPAQNVLQIKIFELYLQKTTPIMTFTESNWAQCKVLVNKPSKENRFKRSNLDHKKTKKLIASKLKTCSTSDLVFLANECSLRILQNQKSLNILDILNLALTRLFFCYTGKSWFSGGFAPTERGKAKSWGIALFATPPPNPQPQPEAAMPQTKHRDKLKLRKIFFEIGKELLIDYGKDQSVSLSTLKGDINFDVFNQQNYKCKPSLRYIHVSQNLEKESFGFKSLSLDENPNQDKRFVTNEFTQKNLAYILRKIAFPTACESSQISEVTTEIIEEARSENYFNYLSIKNVDLNQLQLLVNQTKPWWPSGEKALTSLYPKSFVLDKHLRINLTNHRTFVNNQTNLSWPNKLTDFSVTPNNQFTWRHSINNLRSSPSIVLKYSNNVNYNGVKSDNCRIKHEQSFPSYILEVILKNFALEKSYLNTITLYCSLKFKVS